MTRIGPWRLICGISLFGLHGGAIGHTELVVRQNAILETSSGRESIDVASMPIRIESCGAFGQLIPFTQSERPYLGAAIGVAERELLFLPNASVGTHHRVGTIRLVDLGLWKIVSKKNNVVMGLERRKIQTPGDAEIVGRREPGVPEIDNGVYVVRRVDRDRSVIRHDVGAQLPFFLIAHHPALPSGSAECERSESYSEFLKPCVLSLVGAGMLFFGLWGCILGWANSFRRWALGAALILGGYILQVNYPLCECFLTPKAYDITQSGDNLPPPGSWRLSYGRQIERCRADISLVGRQKRDDDVFGSATLTPKPWAHISQWKIVAESSPKLYQRQARRVLALAAVRGIEVTVVDVSEGGGLESRVFHVDERSAASLWIARG
jgi:hypothetical protein